MKTLALLALAATMLSASAAFAAVTYDGTSIPTDFAGLLKATQTCYTGFGDTSGVNYGSELDQLFVARGPEGIYVGVSGNLETNGNAYVMLFDTVPGGSNVLSATNGPGALTGLNGTTLDPGFAPEYALTVNTAGGTTWVNLTDLVANLDRYLGHNPMNGGTGELIEGDNYNFASVCFNNTNIAGVTDNAARTPEENMIDAATAATGLEVVMPWLDLGIEDPFSFTSIGVMVILDGPGGWLSNQTLPGLGGGYANLQQGGSNIDFANIPGDQFAVVDVTYETTNLIAIDGSAIPVDFDGHLVATQDNHTGFGDRSGEEGSELDQLFVGQDSGGLQIGITGNLETGGNFWLIFIESGPGGSNTLTIPDGVGPQSGVLQAMRGTVFDAGFAPTHVLCFNTWGGTAWVDMVDLRTGVSRYLGHSAVNGGSGALVEGDNPNGALLAFDNTNRAGVTGTDANDPASATTGAEIYLPFADIGRASCTVKLMVALVGNIGYVSNQFLAPLDAATSNLGTPPVDLQTVGGAQFVSEPLVGTVFNSVGSVQEAKLLPDSTPVKLPARVSAAFGGVYYVQTLGEPFGVAVYDTSLAPLVGSTVQVDGFLTVANGERAIGACYAELVAPPDGTQVEPTGMGAAAVGGGTSGPNPGVTGGSGPCNLGVLVKVWGVVTGVDAGRGFFYVNDGSNIQDGTLKPDESPYVGIRVQSDAVANEGDFVCVTGIASAFATYDASYSAFWTRMVRTRTASDVVLLP